tara:strand:- start:1221 stop:3992 length:2772 start_codon:yes stop_codon:yes gene_type:complete
MPFDAPEWFLLLGAFLLTGWFWPNLQLWRPLRVFALLIATILLSEPQFDKAEDSLDLWVLLDRSESTEELIDTGLPEWRELLNKARPSRKDQLFFVDYAAEVLEQGLGDSAVFTGKRNLTRTNLAIQNVLALADQRRPSRILAFTDGYATEPLVEAAAKLKARGIPLDFRLVREEINDDFRIAKIQIPMRVQAREPFVLGITVRGFSDTSIPLQIMRNGTAIAENIMVPIKDGVGKVEFTDRLPEVGSYRYTAAISPPVDAHPGNNKAERWIEVTGGPRVLLVTKYTDDPLIEALSEQGFTIETISNPFQLEVGLLSGTRALIINNVPAFEIPADFLSALNFFVNEQGGGLLMAGGKQSFGSGGYFESSIDPLLPVSMELKNEHRKLAVAMAIVMDRSGSMGMTVDQAGKLLTKMQLANTGAAKAIELLGSQDQISIHAVDSKPHSIIKLTEIGNNKRQWMNTARRIESRGGGIFVYEGLKAAWDELKKTELGTRHIILFSDAADSEKPGNYQQLLEEITANGGTVSVIGLGTRSDPDAPLLEDIAALGNGRVFFTSQPLEIPQIFAQETVTVARSSFIKDPVATFATGQWAEISPKGFDFLPEVDGYNLSYAKKMASTALVADDSYLGPLIAYWRRGIGRSMAVSFPLGGEYSDKIRSWKDYGNFVQTATRWLMGSETPPGLGLRHRLEGTRLTVDLLYEGEDWNRRLSENPPRIKMVEGQGDQEPFEIAWRRVAPGHFSVTRDLDEGQVIRGAVQAGSHALPFGPVAVANSAEWSFDPERLSEFREVARLSGGRELVDLSTAWIRPPSTTSTTLRVPLLFFLLFTVLLDALITRTGWRIPILVPVGKAVRNTQRRNKAIARRKNRKDNFSEEATAKGKDPEKPLNTDPVPVPAISREEAPTSTGKRESERSSRFDRAKRRK